MGWNRPHSIDGRVTGMLRDKIALVTGADGGIGGAIARAYAEAGATVLAADRSGDTKLADLLKAEGRDVVPVLLDVADQASVDAAIAKAVDLHGGIDILVNAAGVFHDVPLRELERQDWRRVFEVNVFGLAAVTQAASAAMIGRGGGRIINIASIGGRRADEKTPVYSASKAAVISLTQSAALDLIRHRVNVNAIAPGPVRTSLWEDLDRSFSRRYLDADPGAFTALAEAAIPAGRLAEPDDIVGAALFLASPASRFVVGQTLNVDGGVMLN